MRGGPRPRPRPRPLQRRSRAHRKVGPCPAALLQKSCNRAWPGRLQGTCRPAHNCKPVAPRARLRGPVYCCFPRAPAAPAPPAARVPLLIVRLASQVVLVLQRPHLHVTHTGSKVWRSRAQAVGAAALRRAAVCEAGPALWHGVSRPADAFCATASMLAGRQHGRQRAAEQTAATQGAAPRSPAAAAGSQAPRHPAAPAPGKGKGGHRQR